MFNSSKLLLCSICSLLLACSDHTREKALTDREQVLAEKEKAFASKQMDYESLLKMRDSLSSIKKTDTIIKRWPTSIAGLWSSKLVCIASNCNEYVIGDQKTNELWNFTYDTTNTIVSILSNKTLVRIYKGFYDSSAIMLHFKTDSLAKRAVYMTVQLDQLTDKMIKGTQSIQIDSTCNAKFSVELSRIRNN